MFSANRVVEALVLISYLREPSQRLPEIPVIFPALRPLRARVEAVKLLEDVVGGRVEVTRRFGLLKRESQETPEVELVAGRQTGWAEDLCLRALCVPVPIRIEIFNLVDKAFVQRDRSIEWAEGMLNE